MLNEITLIEDPLAPDTWETVEADCICAFLAGRYSSFPQGARIYQGQVATENDVTPGNAEEIKTLQKMEGPFYVVLYPADPVTIIAVVVFAVVLAVTLSQPVPKPPTPLARKQSNASPNNELSERENRPRINGRIPDIFGTVRSTPDLIAPNYVVYENNLKVENSLMCIGKGSFEIPVEEIKEGTTTAQQITDNTVEIYGPGVNPTSGNPAQIVVGQPITENFVSTNKNKAVNGQTLDPDPQDPIVIGNDNIEFESIIRQSTGDIFGTLILATGAGIPAGPDFRNFIAPGAQLKITDTDIETDILDMNAAPLTTGATVSRVLGIQETASILTLDDEPPEEYNVVELYDLDFTIDGIDYNIDGIYKFFRFKTAIYLITGVEINPNWAVLDNHLSEVGSVRFENCKMRYGHVSTTLNLSGTYSVGEVGEESIEILGLGGNEDWEKLGLSEPLTSRQSPTLENLTGSTVGPFILDDPETSEVIVNFGALQGLYKDNGTTQTEVDVSVEISITPIDESGDPVGSVIVKTLVVTGSSASKSVRATTGRFLLLEPSRCKVECKRITPFVEGFTGQVIEEIKWLDLYSSKTIVGLDFGDVTTVRSKVKATAGATSVSSRELNMLVTRKIPQRISGSDFTTELFPTNNAADIVSFVSLDPHIGNRDKTEIDFDNIYNTLAEVEDYFGSAIPAEFNYTFDNDNLSYEEIMSSIANAVFCIAYRRGSQIKLNFEKETENSTLLFNHRNKLPGSETRTVRFGNQNENDGVEFEYVDPSDDSIQTLYLPDQNAINPQRVDMPGIRNKLHAYFHANRVWNKIRFQHISTNFRATQEADLLVLNDRILNADNTRPEIQDGEVEDQRGLELVLSQKVDLTEAPNYFIFLQYPDGSVESIAITAGLDSYSVVLASPPAINLSLDLDNFARTTYLIVRAEDVESNAFLVTEKTPGGDFTSEVTAINYDSRYYGNDKDLENGIVNSNGNLI